MGGNGENRLKLVILETFPFTPPTPIILSPLSHYISPRVLIPSTLQVSLSALDSTHLHSSYACLIQHSVNHLSVHLHSAHCPLSPALSPPLTSFWEKGRWCWWVILALGWFMLLQALISPEKLPVVLIGLVSLIHYTTAFWHMHTKYTLENLLGWWLP